MIDNIIFPLDIAYGSSGGPRFKTDVVEVNSGYEKRNQVWSQSKCFFDASTGIQSQEDLARLIAFFRSRGGKARGFLWRDWSDYTSKSDGVSQVGFDDQIIGYGTGTKDYFPLIKRYGVENDPVQHIRGISYPDLSTVRVAVDGNEISSFVIQDGTIIFGTAPDLNAEITAGYEFYVPVRFDTDSLSVRLDDYLSGSASVPIVELRV